VDTAVVFSCYFFHLAVPILSEGRDFCGGREAWASTDLDLFVAFQGRPLSPVADISPSGLEFDNFLVLLCSLLYSKCNEITFNRIGPKLVESIEGAVDAKKAVRLSACVVSLAHPIPILASSWLIYIWW